MVLSVLVCPLLSWEPLRCPISLHQCRVCDDCRVTSVSVKPEFECCSFYSKVSSCCFKFLYFIYIFSSQKSLYNSWCLVWPTFIFLFNVRSFEKHPYTEICVSHPYMLFYTGASLLTAAVICPFSLDGPCRHSQNYRWKVRILNIGCQHQNWWWLSWICKYENQCKNQWL